MKLFWRNVSLNLELDCLNEALSWLTRKHNYDEESPIWTSTFKSGYDISVINDFGDQYQCKIAAEFSLLIFSVLKLFQSSIKFGAIHYSDWKKNTLDC